MALASEDGQRPSAPIGQLPNSSERGFVVAVAVQQSHRYLRTNELGRRRGDPVANQDVVQAATVRHPGMEDHVARDVGGTLGISNGISARQSGRPAHMTPQMSSPRSGRCTVAHASTPTVAIVARASACER